jgi:O-antigen/teichoic acid export membrane protein
MSHSSSADPSSADVSTSLRRRLARQFAWVSTGRLLAALLQAVLLVLAARAMPVGTFGRLMALIGVVTLVQVLFDCGVPTYVARERAATPQSGGLATAMRFIAASATAMTATVAAALTVLALTVSPLYWSMLPLAVWAAGERNADARLAVSFADGDVHINTANLVSRRLASILGFAGLTQVGLSPLLAFSTATAVSAAASATFAYLYVRRRITMAPTLGFLELLRRSRAYWISSMALQARNLDAVLVSAVAGVSQAGLYSSGSRLISPLQLLPSSLASVLLPTSARSQGSAEVLVRLIRLALAVVATLCALYVGIFAGADIFVRNVLGEEYAGSTDVIRAIVLGLPFAAANSMFEAILNGQGRSKRVATAALCATAVVVIGVPIAAAQGGAVAAAYVLAAAFVVQCGVLSQGLARLRRDSAAETSGAPTPKPEVV